MALSEDNCQFITKGVLQHEKIINNFMCYCGYRTNSNGWMLKFISKGCAAVRDYRSDGGRSRNN